MDGLAYRRTVGCKDKPTDGRMDKRMEEVHLEGVPVPSAQLTIRKKYNWPVIQIKLI